jgi:hypothetical protein
MSIPDMAARFSGALDVQSLGKLHHGSNANGCHARSKSILRPAIHRSSVTRLLTTSAQSSTRAPCRDRFTAAWSNGVGQALLERAPSWEELGHPTATSSFHYPAPPATDVPSIAWIDNGLQSATNAFGAEVGRERRPSDGDERDRGCAQRLRRGMGNSDAPLDRSTFGTSFTADLSKISQQTLEMRLLF